MTTKLLSESYSSNVCTASFSSHAMVNFSHFRFTVNYTATLFHALWDGFVISPACTNKRLSIFDHKHETLLPPSLQHDSRRGPPLIMRLYNKSSFYPSRMVVPGHSKMLLSVCQHGSQGGTFV